MENMDRTEAALSLAAGAQMQSRLVTGVLLQLISQLSSRELIAVQPLIDALQKSVSHVQSSRLLSGEPSDSQVMAQRAADEAATFLSTSLQRLLSKE